MSRDAQATSRQLEQFLLGQLPGATNVRVTNLEAPTQGASHETLSFDGSWIDDRGRLQRRAMVARIQPGASRQLLMDTDVLRDQRVLGAVAAFSDVPVPPLLFSEPAGDILGSPFFVTARVEGRVPPDDASHTQDNAPNWVAELAPAERGRLWYNALETLARIHTISWRPHFEFLDVAERGAPGLEQHLTWLEQFFTWVVPERNVPIIEAGLRYAHERQPQDAEVGLVWGDARMGNIIFAKDLSVAAILDWEISTLGPGEIDLGWWLMVDRLYEAAETRLEGVPDREATIALYETAIGRPVRDIEYFEVIAAIQAAILIVRMFGSALTTPRESTMSITSNPATQLIAQTLGLPGPEDGVCHGDRSG